MNRDIRFALLSISWITIIILCLYVGFTSDHWSRFIFSIFGGGSIGWFVADYFIRK